MAFTLAGVDKLDFCRFDSIYCIKKHADVMKNSTRIRFLYLFRIDEKCKFTV